jgi:hypothetical protein
MRVPSIASALHRAAARAGSRRDSRQRPKEGGCREGRDRQEAYRPPGGGATERGRLARTKSRLTVNAPSKEVSWCCIEIAAIQVFLGEGRFDMERTAPLHAPLSRRFRDPRNHEILTNSDNHHYRSFNHSGRA